MTNYAKEYDSSVIIITERTGGGHESVANALCADLNQRLPDNILVEKYYGFSEAGRIAQWLGELYNVFLRSYPRLERAYFGLINVLRVDKQWLFVKEASKILDTMVKEKNPKVLISVHPLFQEAMVQAVRSKNLDIPLITVMTDPFPPFWKAWTCRSMDYYFVPEMETRAEVTKGKKGVKAGKISVAGMCVHPKFFPVQAESVKEARTSLELSPDKFTLFVNAGWNGNNSYTAVLDNLLNSDLADIQVIFLAGNNKELFDRAVNLVANSNRGVLFPEYGKAPTVEKGKLPIKVRGFSDDMERLMRASDIMVSKTGAATGYESFTCSLPIIVDKMHGLMPQEQGLAELILKQKLGYLLKKPDDISDIVKKCLNDETIEKYSDDDMVKKHLPKGSKFSDWKKNLQTLRKTNATKDICAQIENYLKKKTEDKNHKFSIDHSLF